jgi:cold shock CspA family protein
MKGMVTTYFENKKYGFITDVDGISRFFHASNYSGIPAVGVRVEFALAEPTKLGKDKQCVNVAPITESAGGGVQ